MSLSHHPLHQGTLLRIACVCCQPDHAGCGGLEHTLEDSLAFPLRGVFLKHHESGAEVVAHAGQALFFNAGEGYRVSHPAGGDDCLTLQAAAPVLHELLACFDAPAAERERHPRSRPLTVADVTALVVRHRQPPAPLGCDPDAVAEEAAAAQVHLGHVRQPHGAYPTWSTKRRTGPNASSGGSLAEQAIRSPGHGRRGPAGPDSRYRGAL